MLKSIVLAATLAALGGLSLQPALAQGHTTGATVQSSALSAKEPQGEHVRTTSITYQAANASDDTGNACVTQSTASGCTPTAADDTATFRDRNDISRHRQFETQLR